MNSVEEQTEKLLSLATEIGLLLRETAELRDFQRAAAEFNTSRASVDLLERYSIIEEENAARVQAGDRIEEFLLEETASMRETVESDDIIMNFLQARKIYMNLLEQVQKELERSISVEE